MRDSVSRFPPFFIFLLKSQEYFVIFLTPIVLIQASEPTYLCSNVEIFYKYRTSC